MAMDSLVGFKLTKEFHTIQQFLLLVRAANKKTNFARDGFCRFRHVLIFAKTSVFVAPDF